VGLGIAKISFSPNSLAPRRIASFPGKLLIIVRPRPGFARVHQVFDDKSSEADTWLISHRLFFLFS
jgi:hypothetical protein